MRIIISQAAADELKRRIDTAVERPVLTRLQFKKLCRVLQHATESNISLHRQYIAEEVEFDLPVEVIR